MSLLAVPVLLNYLQTIHTQARSLLAITGITLSKLIIHGLSDILARSLLAKAPNQPILKANKKFAQVAAAEQAGLTPPQRASWSQTASHLRPGQLTAPAPSASKIQNQVYSTHIQAKHHVR